MGGVKGNTAELRKRYSKLTNERFFAMTASREFRRSQSCWLRRLNRRRPFPSIDDWVASERSWRVDSPESFEAFSDEVSSLSRIFAVASWHVIWAMFVRGHTPDTSVGKMFPVDVFHPKARLLTSDRNAVSLSEAASGTGIYVDFVPMGDQRLPVDASPACMILVELPLELPPDLAVLECRYALSAGRNVLRRSGIEIPFRIRDSSAALEAFFAAGISDSGSKTALAEACQSAGLGLIEKKEYRSKGSQIQWLAAASLEIVFSPAVKADVLVSSARRMIRAARLVLKSQGVDLGMRLRPSPLADQTGDLMVDGRNLPRRGLGDLADAYLEGFPSSAGTMTPEGTRAVRTAKSRRGKLKKRLMRKRLIRCDQD